MRDWRVVALLLAGSRFSFTEPGWEGALALAASARGAGPNNGPGRSSAICLPQAATARAARTATMIGFI